MFTISSVFIYLLSVSRQGWLFVFNISSVFTHLLSVSRQSCLCVFNVNSVFAHLLSVSRQAVIVSEILQVYVEVPVCLETPVQ